MTIKSASLSASVLAVSGLLCLAGPAGAASSEHLNANLKPVNDANARGTSMVTVNGTTITVDLAAQGLLADAPHAAHIHYGSDARHECPTFSMDDKNDNNRLTTSEGIPAYGGIVVSLTKTGDTSPKSGLAVDRFDTATGGTINYERGSIKVSEAVAKDIESGESVVVVHGVDYNKDGKYSGSAKSDLDPSLPAEATDPAICGVLMASPAGGVEAGSGSTGGTEHMPLVAGGALAALAGLGLFGRRLVTTRR